MIRMLFVGLLLVIVVLSDSSWILTAAAGGLLYSLVSTGGEPVNYFIGGIVASCDMPLYYCRSASG